MNGKIKKPKIIVICGPTCIGKTAISIKIAKAVNGEIISADSMQIYRYMNIGTAKPTLDEQAGIPHHIIDIVDPDEHFDTAKFASIASSKIEQLNKDGKIPIVAGGTGLYIKSLIYGLSSIKPADPKILLRLKNECSKHGTDFLYQKLCKCDPKAAEKIHPNDTFRLTRALEVFEVTGKTISSFHQEHRFKDKKFDFLQIGLTMEREALYNRINRRVEIMIHEGLLDEVKALIARGYKKNLRPMQSIGYRHMADYIDKFFSWEDTVKLMQRDTRRYAKRQMTWFRYDKNILWEEPGRADHILEKIKRFF